MCLVHAPMHDADTPRHLTSVVRELFVWRRTMLCRIAQDITIVMLRHFFPVSHGQGKDGSCSLPSASTYWTGTTSIRAVSNNLDPMASAKTSSPTPIAPEQVRPSQLETALANNTTSVQALTDRIAALEQQLVPKKIPYDPADRLYFETLPARLAIWVNLPLASVCWWFAMTQITPMHKWLPGIWPTSIWWLLSLTLIPYLVYRYETKHRLWRPKKDLVEGEGEGDLPQQVITNTGC
jgi:hypothetical protein